MPVNPFLFAWSPQMWSVLQGPATLFSQPFLDALMRVMSSSLWARSRTLPEWVMCGGEWIAISPANSRWLERYWVVAYLSSGEGGLILVRNVRLSIEIRSSWTIYFLAWTEHWRPYVLSLVWQCIFKCLRCWYHVSIFLLFLCYDYYNSISKPSVLCCPPIPYSPPPPPPALQSRVLWVPSLLDLENFLKLNILEQI